MLRQAIVEYGMPLCEAIEPTPEPRGREVLLRIRHCGVCHSDLHLLDGHFDLGGGKSLDVRGGRELPFTLGHEIEGEVEAVGPEATGVAIGQRRVVFPWIGCGQCDSCRAGEEQICVKPQQMGIQVDGGYATHLLVPDARYLIDYAGIPAERAGSLMCSGLTAYAALRRLGNLAERGPVLIMGLGGVGMMGFAFAKAMFAHAPVVADISAAKREAALAAGAASAWDPSDPEARRAFLKATGGVFGAVDFVGAEVSFNFAQAALKKGGKLVVAGLFGGSFSMPIPFLPMRAIAIEGSYVGTLAEAEAMIDLVRSGKVPPLPIETRPLAAANQALDDLRGGRVMGRIVLTT
ncbi:alcohol dehydrogenase [Prosthecomicrobium hirschii]|uniref:alcohol dehydrogenase n=1 Tax=Prosthecodimorpha hirschii TaxID=665126 RepID=A0A0P6VQ24_9HYPH|nr:alcohol dehydrogenase [Prosthecomicrobium hirschii]KPL54887.1 alcohol dehydrogenase [Prosthecomicrobium hirschii]